MEEKQLEIESKSSIEFSLYEVIKRLIDFVCSFLGVLILSPFFNCVNLFKNHLYSYDL